MDFYLSPKTWVKVKAINMVKNVLIVLTNLQQMLQKRLNSANKSTKTASKREIQKTAEGTGDLIGNEIADKKQVFQEKNLQKNYQVMKQKKM